MMNSRQLLYLSLLFFGIISCKSKTTFELLPSDQTGIHFSNQIVENDTLSILKYEYLYNGSGVGMGDFNNDGLLDLFFSGNQANGTLYLNKGEMKFEDVSKKAGIDTKNRWCAGVSVVDINGDGLLDVYVSVTLKNSDKDRENLLFVNQGIKEGIPTFKEMAVEYGINDSGHSQHAAFFDYDKDGDLDLYVLTDKITEFPSLFRPKVNDGTYPNTDRLYRNDWSETLKHPVYTNVSKEAGVTLEGFGLGINICDINQDNWPDIYVTNDYVSDDILYINNQNGTFTDQSKAYFKHTSLSAMGNDVADINNDGLADIVALDMLPKSNDRKKQLAPGNHYQSYLNSDTYGFTYQYMRNTLQLNAGKQTNGQPYPFQEIGLMAGVAETEWSWCPSLADFDNDGYRDLLITNGFPKDVTDRDFMSYQAESKRLTSESIMLEKLPVIKINNYAFKNMGGLKFDDVSANWGINIASFSNGAVYGDLDNDGDLDYVVNNINDEAFVYKNNTIDQEKEKSQFLRVKFEGKGKNVLGIGAKIEGVFADGSRFYYENTPYRGYLSSVETVAHIGLGSKLAIKEMRIFWPNDSMQVIKNPGKNKVMTVKIGEAKMPIQSMFDYEKPLLEDISKSLQVADVHKEYDFVDFNFQTLTPFKLSQLGPGCSVGDINGDGLEDFFVGGSKFYSGLFYVQQINGQFVSKPLDGAIDQPKKMGEDLGSLLADFDRDGDLDLYITRGGTEDKANSPSFQDVLYTNDGQGNFKLDVAALPVFLESNSAVRSIDFDRDGDLDVFVSGRNVPFEYPKGTVSRLLRNDSKPGKIKFSDQTAQWAPELLKESLVCDAIWTDVNQDGWVDLVLAGEYAPIQVFENQKAKLKKWNETGLEKYTGLWASITSADFDQDGDMDFIAGNMGKNTILRASTKQPVEMVHGDLDGNGLYDIFPFVYFQGPKGLYESYPLFGKDDTHKQLNATRARYVYYKDFGKAKQEDLFTDAEKKKSSKVSLTENASVYIENVGKGKFVVHELPVMAQVSALNGMQVIDINQDGYLDVLFVGNNFGNEVSTGRYDASNGGVLLGDGKGKFRYQPNSGLFVPSDAKSLVSIQLGKDQIGFIAFQNRGTMYVFKPVKSFVPLAKAGKDFTYQFMGKKQKVNWNYGSSYLSQSGSAQGFVPKGASLAN
ncbi:VCBS repeat-containing protein [Aquirufa ecclesiirivi]